MTKLSEFLPKLYLPLLVGLLFVFTWQPLRGIDDFWAHASVGRWMVEHGRVPDHTLNLWAPGTPIPWICHSWLSQLSFYACLATGSNLESGAQHALWLTFALALANLLVLWRIWTCRARASSLATFLFAITIWVSSPRLHPRPEVFSAACFAVLLGFLLVWTERRAEGELPTRLGWRAAGLGVLFALWANFHGGVATGLVFLGLTLVGELVQDWVDKRPLKKSLVLLGVLAVCAAAINLNPYGAHYWAALRPVGGTMFAQINEWKPIWQPPLMMPEAFMVTAILAVLTLNAWLQNPKRRIAHLFWLLFATIVYVIHRRQIQQFGQVCIVIMAANAAALDTKHFWATLMPKSGGEISPKARLLARCGVCLGLLGALPGIAAPGVLQLRSLAPELPRPAAQFMKKIPHAKLFCDYSSSSYLDWHLNGTPPLFIDLLNAYPDHLMDDYFDAIYLKPEGLRRFYQLGVTHVFVKHFQEGDKTHDFDKYLRGDARWKKVYQGLDGTIWEFQK